MSPKISQRFQISGNRDLIINGKHLQVGVSLLHNLDFVGEPLHLVNHILNIQPLLALFRFQLVLLLNALDAAGSSVASVLQRPPALLHAYDLFAGQPAQLQLAVEVAHRYRDEFIVGYVDDRAGRQGRLRNCVNIQVGVLWTCQQKVNVRIVIAVLFRGIVLSSLLGIASSKNLLRHLNGLVSSHKSRLLLLWNEVGVNNYQLHLLSF